MNEEALLLNLATLRSTLPSLRHERGYGAYENEIYEAVAYWVDLADKAVDRDKRVDFQDRANEELELWRRLSDALVDSAKRSDEVDYEGVLEAAHRVLKQLQEVPRRKDGYLETVKAIKSSFAFLDRYGFRIERVNSLGVRYVAESMYMDLQWTANPVYSCSFGSLSEPSKTFWVDDILFLHGDPRYRSFRTESVPKTVEGVRKWFADLAFIWSQYGQDVLNNVPDAFDRLSESQALRDRENSEATTE